MADDFSGFTTIGPAKPPRGFLDPGPPEFAPLDPRSGESIEGMQTIGPAQPPKPTLASRAFDRITGSDVEHDPQAWPRLGTTIVGAITGGEIGSKFPLHPILGTLVGSAAGAVIGAVAPEMTMEIAEDIGVLPDGYRKEHGLSEDDLKTVMLGEAIVDIATNGGVLAARLMGRGVATSATGSGTAAAQDIADKAYREKINVLPVQVGDRRVARGFITVFGRAPWMAGPLKVAASKAEVEMAERVAGLPVRLAPLISMSDVSKEVLADAQTLMVDLNDVYTKKFDYLFTEAESLGVKVRAFNLTDAAQNITTAIEKASPQAMPGLPAPRLPAEYEELQTFIAQHVVPLTMTQGAVTRGAPQELRAMDTLLSSLDDYALKLSARKTEPGDRVRGQVIKWVNEMRMQTLADVVGNAQQQVGVNAQGQAMWSALTPPAQHVVNGFYATDGELATTMQDIFDTAAAKKMGVVRSRALRGAQITDSATTTPEDNLAKLIMSSESPQMIVDLEKLITPTTFSNVASAVLNSKLEASFVAGEKAGQKLFDAAGFSKLMGIGEPNSGKYLQMTELLKRAGGLEMKEVEALMDVAKKMSDTEIPNVSMFLARRASIGGIRAAMTALSGSMIAGAGGGLAATGGGGGMSVGGLMTGILFIGGARLFSRIISNPASAQGIRTVMSKEASIVQRRAATAKVIRLGIWSGVNVMWGRDEASQMDGIVGDVVGGIYDAVDRAAGALK